MHVEAVEFPGCEPVIIMVDHARDQGGFLSLNDCYRLVGVELQEVLAKVTLREVKVGEGGVRFLQLVVDSVDPISGFKPPAGLRVVLHDLPGAYFPMDIICLEYSREFLVG